MQPKIMVSISASFSISWSSAQHTPKDFDFGRQTLSISKTWDYKGKGGFLPTKNKSSVNKMVAMTDIAEREAAAEMLLEAKGFSDVVVSITDDNCDVVLNMGEVTDAKRAQVEDIVKRKTNISADKIVITPIVVTDAE